jgi:hypothetical protein
MKEKKGRYREVGTSLVEKEQVKEGRGDKEGRDIDGKVLSGYKRAEF